MSNDVNENRIFVSSIIKHTLVLTNVNIWKLIFDFFYTSDDVDVIVFVFVGSFACIDSKIKANYSAIAVH